VFLAIALRPRVPDQILAVQFVRDALDADPRSSP
jgi:hypothetical protein